MTPTRVPAIVVGGGLNALGVVRSLARGNVSVYLVDTTRWTPAALSRHCEFVQVESLQGDALIRGLIPLGRAGAQRPVLILNGDREVEAISEAREQIEPLFRISLASRAMVRTLADKTEFQRFAERVGLPVPRAAVVTSVAELAVLDTLIPPLVIKPADKALVLAGLVERAVRVNSLDEARSSARRMLEAKAPLVAQEWIEGGDADIYFSLFSVDARGVPSSMFYGRKLVCEPVDVGSTAICIEATPIDPEMERITLDFIRLTSYRGIGGLECKRDRRTGRFIIIEPTVGRTDWQEEIATLCGVNVPLANYLDEIGEGCTFARSETRLCAWRDSALRSAQGSGVPNGAHLYDAAFRRDDLLPGLYQYLVEKSSRRVVRRVLRSLGISRAIAPARTAAARSP